MNDSQEDDHVKRIAQFAEGIIAAAGNTLIDLDDPKKGYLRIRVGFHSGPVVSQVVGSLNPRFVHVHTCLPPNRTELNEMTLHCFNVNDSIIMLINFCLFANCS